MTARRMRLIAIVVLVLAGCSGSSVDDALDLAEGVPRKTIDASRLGVNAFVNDSRFGSIASQFGEVESVLRLNRVRILLAWNEQVQPSPAVDPDFSFYDDIVYQLPPQVEALAVLTGVPSWLHDSSTWDGGSPRVAFVTQWVRRVAARYAGVANLAGFQIWNEPNMPDNNDNHLLELLNSPENYVELLAQASNAVRDNAPGKLVVGAATTAINQNFPDALNYNRAMRDTGASQFLDIWAIHYYGKQFENIVRDGGVRDFVNGLGLPVWVTESGAQGVNSQLPYGEQVWPYLFEQMPPIERVYVYQFTEATPPDITYGLRNLTPGLELSDLYVWLRDRAA